jgi:hypothetical protein
MAIRSGSTRHRREDIGGRATAAVVAPGGRAREGGRPVTATGEVGGRELVTKRVRAVVTVGDQVLSSLSNVVLGVAVAANVATVEYGRFAVVFGVYGISLGLCRALVGDPLVVRFSGREPELQREEGRGALGAGALVGGAVGLGCLAVGASLRGPTGLLACLLAPCLPLLFLQDGYRYLFFTTRRPHHAVAVDAVWNVGFVAVLVGVPSVRSGGVAAPFVVAWSAAAAVSVVVAAALSATAPDIRRGWSWLRAHLDLSPRFAAEFAVNAASAHLVIYSAALLSGYRAVGALRGAHVLMGPLWLASNGLVAAAVPEGVRLKDRSPARFVQGVWALTAALVAVSVAWTVVAVHLPDGVGRSLLGETWPEVQPLMTALGLFGAGFVATSGFVAGLRALAAARRSFVATVPTGVLIIVGGTIGAAVNGAEGAIVGTIGPVWAGTVAVAWQFRRAMAEVRLM